MATKRGPSLIAIFEPYIWEKAYGNLRYIAEIFKRLDRSRFLPLLLVPRCTHFTDELANGGSQVIRIPASTTLASYNRRLLRSWAMIRALPSLLAYNFRIARTLREHRVSVLQCHNVRAALMSGLGARLAGCPLVLYIKTMLVNPYLDGIAFMLADKILFQNQVNLDACHPGLVERYRNKIDLLRNGVDLDEVERAECSSGTDLRKALNIRDDRLNLACMATLSPQKGLDYLLDAMAMQHPQRRVALYLMGTDEHFPGYKEKLEALACAQALEVFFLGYCEEPLEILASMDALVLPSLHEDAPRSVMEAMALGKPIVATNVGGIPSMVEDGVTGFLVEPRNAAALADAIMKLVCDPELAAEMGSRARQIARDRYSLADNIRGLERTYMQLCEVAAGYNKADQLIVE